MSVQATRPGADPLKKKIHQAKHHNQPPSLLACGNKSTAAGLRVLRSARPLAKHNIRIHPPASDTSQAGTPGSFQFGFQSFVEVLCKGFPSTLLFFLEPRKGDHDRCLWKPHGIGPDPQMLPGDAKEDSASETLFSTPQQLSWLRVAARPPCTPASGLNMATLTILT